MATRYRWCLALAVALFICGCSRQEFVVTDPDGNASRVQAPWTFSVLPLLVPVVVLVLAASAWLHWKRSRDAGVLLLALAATACIVTFVIGPVSTAFFPSFLHYALQLQQVGIIAALLLALAGGLRTLWAATKSTSPETDLPVENVIENPYEAPRSK